MSDFILTFDFSSLRNIAGEGKKMMTIIGSLIIYMMIGSVIAKLYAGDQRKAGKIERIGVDMGLIFIFWPLLLLFALAARVVPRAR